MTESDEDGTVLTAGVDIGGSTVRCGLVMKEALLWRGGVPLAGHMSGIQVAEIVVRLLESGLEELCSFRLSSIGVGIPGPMVREGGVSLLSPNLAWRDVRFGSLLKKRLSNDVPVVFDHDVRVAALAEQRYGAAREVKDFLYVKVGTGVGSTIVLGDRQHLGVRGLAGEIGHLRFETGGLPCGCGNRGCLEQYASAQAVARRAVQLGLRVDHAQPTAQDVARMSERGHKEATTILKGAATALAFGLATAIDLLDLTQIVIGGGLAESGSEYWDTLRLETARLVMPSHRVGLQIGRGELGDDAGILGAALIAKASKDIVGGLPFVGGS